MPKRSEDRSLKSKGNRKRTFRNCNDHECNSDNENLDKRNTLLIGRTGRFTRSELNEEAYHESGEKKETGQTSQLGDQFSQSVQLELERSILCVTSEG